MTQRINLMFSQLSPETQAEIKKNYQLDDQKIAELNLDCVPIAVIDENVFLIRRDCPQWMDEDWPTKEEEEELEEEDSEQNIA